MDGKFVIFFSNFFRDFFSFFFISFCACEYSLLIAGLSSIEPDFEALCYVIQPVKQPRITIVAVNNLGVDFSKSILSMIISLLFRTTSPKETDTSKTLIFTW